MHYATRLASFATLLVLLASPAHAQLFRAYLSIGGNDANPCTLQQPCRLLPAALAAVQDRGEIWMLDSANYNTGPVTISKPVTIMAVPGAVGSVVALGGNALNITANDHVVLRNLEIRPFPGHDEYIGIRKTGGGALDIERCHMAGFGFETSRAIEIAASGLVTIRDCTISSTWWGVHVNAANAKVVVSDSAFTTMFDKGVYAHAGETTVSNVTMSTPIGAIHLNVVGGAKLFVVDSRLDCADRGDGIIASGLVDEAFLSVSGTTVSNCWWGVVAQGPAAQAWLSGSTLVGNDIGVGQIDESDVQSAGDNAVRKNDTDVYGVISTPGTL